MTPLHSSELFQQWSQRKSSNCSSLGWEEKDTEWSSLIARHTFGQFVTLAEAHSKLAKNRH